MDNHHMVYPILLAGGTGSRLWPVSRELYPKQLVKFIGEDSLIQATIKRLDPLLIRENIRIVCGIEHLHEIARHIEEIGLSPENKIICEPCGRNTAPAILLAVLNILKSEKDAVLCIFPADHVINDIKEFHGRLNVAIQLAADGHIVTFGIKPGYPETGYGYIEGGNNVGDTAMTAKRFVEKPDMKTAREYLKAGNFFWNSGMFAFRASVILEEFRCFHPDLLVQMEKLVSTERDISKEDYEKLLNISFDYAIMEKTEKGAVLPSDFGWSDIGSWKSLYEFLPKDENNNVLEGDVITNNTHDCFIMGHDRLVAVNNIDNTVVVETPDSIFVSDIDHSRDVKLIVSKLKEKHRKEYHQHRTIFFPWGSKTTLESRKGYNIERLLLYTGATCREEIETTGSIHLTVVEGTVEINTVDGSKSYNAGESAVLQKSSNLRIKNIIDSPSRVILIKTK